MRLISASDVVCWTVSPNPNSHNPLLLTPVFHLPPVFPLPSSSPGFSFRPYPHNQQPQLSDLSTSRKSDLYTAPLFCPHLSSSIPYLPRNTGLQLQFSDLSTAFPVRQISASEVMCPVTGPTLRPRTLAHIILFSLPPPASCQSPAPCFLPSPCHRSPPSDLATADSNRRQQPNFFDLSTTFLYVPSLTTLLFCPHPPPSSSLPRPCLTPP